MVVHVRLSVTVQVIDWKDSSPKCVDGDVVPYVRGRVLIKVPLQGCKNKPAPFPKKRLRVVGIDPLLFSWPDIVKGD